VHDKSSNIRFLVDTGAEVSVIPATQLDHSPPASLLTLQAVDSTRIHTYGLRSCTLNIGLRHFQIGIGSGRY